MADPSFDLSALLGQAQKMQEQLLEAQRLAAEQVVEGVAGGGRVKVQVTGAMQFRRVTIDPEVVDPTDVEMLEDLVLAALHDACTKASALTSQTLGGFDMGALGGLGGFGDLGELGGGGGAIG